MQELPWDLEVRGRVLSAFFWGYLVIQLPAGQLGQLFSVKQLFLLANVSCAVLALLTPLAASYGGWFLVCVIRVLQGLSQVSVESVVYLGIKVGYKILKTKILILE